MDYVSQSFKPDRCTKHDPTTSQRNHYTSLMCGIWSH